jgi:Spherulation-specific family 4
MLSKTNRRFLVSISLGFIIAASLCIVPRYSSGASTGASAGVIVPLYGYPGQNWQSLVQAKEAYPSVPVIAVINPSDGPGSWQDPNFVSGIQQLQSVGISAVGYISTGYASVPLWQVEQEISTYRQFYGLSGVFLDEMSNVPGYESYYSTLTSYASSVGMWITVGNPGAPVPSSYLGTVTNIVAYENAGFPNSGFLSSLSYARNDFSFMSYGVGFNPSYITAAASDVSYMYMTDGSWPAPYTNLASYFTSLMATLAGTYPVSSSGSTSSSSDTVTIDSVDASGNSISGLWTTVWNNGQMVASGYTPYSFNAVPGSTYTVEVANYANYIFDYWAGGSASSSITITPTSNTELSAYYWT